MTSPPSPPSPPPHPALPSGLIYAAIATTGCFVWALAGVQINQSHTAAGSDNLYALWLYWSAYTASWLALTALAWHLHRRHRHTTQATYPRAATIIICIALLARVVTVLVTTPQLSDDIWRYIHDGATLARAQSPYALAPAQLTPDQAPHPPILDKINNPNLVTIYQPTSQYVFAALWLIHPPTMDPLGDYTFRMGFVVFDMAIIVLLLGSLRLAQRSPWWAALYAWHPLAISEIAGSGHQDVIGICMVLVALSMLHKPHPTTIRACLAGIALAAATAVKPIALPLVIPIVWQMRHQHRQTAWCGLSLAITELALYLPFVFWGSGLTRLWDTSQTFVNNWSFNASVYYLTVAVLGHPTMAKLLLAAVLTAILVLWSWRCHDLKQVAQIFFFALILLSSTVYPWYLLWALALIPLQFNHPLWVFSLVISFSYAVWCNPARWHVPLWAIIAQYLPVYSLIVLAAWRLWQHPDPTNQLRAPSPDN